MKSSNCLGQTPQEYLVQRCHVMKRRENLYKKHFYAHDKDKDQKLNMKVSLSTWSCFAFDLPNFLKIVDRTAFSLGEIRSSHLSFSGYHFMTTQINGISIHSFCTIGVQIRSERSFDITPKFFILELLAHLKV